MAKLADFFSSTEEKKEVTPTITENVWFHTMWWRVDHSYDWQLVVMIPDKPYTSTITYHCKRLLTQNEIDKLIKRVHRFLKLPDMVGVILDQPDIRTNYGY